MKKKFMKLSIIMLSIFILVYLIMNNSSEQLVVKAADNNFKKINKNGFEFLWKISGKNIKIKISAKTKGWVAVGFNPSIAMKNANIIIGYVDNKKVYIRDDFGSGIYTHKEDNISNIINKNGSELNDKTQLEFEIPLNSGDKEDSPLVPGKKHKIIMACGKTDSFSDMHKSKTSFEVEL